MTPNDCPSCDDDLDDADRPHQCECGQFFPELRL